MSIYSIIQVELKKAMIEKNNSVKDYIRNVKSRLSEFQVANGLDRTKDPSDEEMKAVISAQVKSLEKAIRQFEMGTGADDLIVEYKAEVKYLKQFLPDDASKSADIEKMVDEAIGQVGFNVGQIMGYIMKNNKDLDGSLVKTIVINKLRR